MKGKPQDQGRWLDDPRDAGSQALRRALDDGPSDDDSFARQRVWNRVQSPWAGMPEPRARWRLSPLVTAAGLLAAGAVLAAVATSVLRAPAPIAEAPARRETAPLPPPATIALTTGPEEHARHRLARGVVAALGPRSALIPGDDAMPPEVKVGRVGFEVPHQAPGRRYSVRAGAFDIVVLGTSFEIAVDDAGVGVAVSTGVVSVEEAGSARPLARLLPGMRWSSATPAEKPNLSRRRPRPNLRAAAARDPAGAHALDEASEARRRGDVAAARARYERLAEAGGPMAEIALYELGGLEAEALHDLPRALVTWGRQRTRYPQGVLRPETDLSIIEALARMGRHDRALDEARGFLARHPTSERRTEVARVAGDLARTRGDCRTAVDFYEVAAQATRPDAGDADDAAFHRAACLATLGDARATTAARDYLTRFPLGRHALDVQRLLAGGKVDASAR